MWTVKICLNRCFLISLIYSVQIREAELRITVLMGPQMKINPTQAAYSGLSSLAGADESTE